MMLNEYCDVWPPSASLFQTLQGRPACTKENKCRNDLGAIFTATASWAQWKNDGLKPAGFVHMQIGVEISRAVENKRIFVIDSDEVTRAALQFMLHDENETHELASVEEAITKCEGWKVDLVLLGHGIVQEHGESVIHEITQRIPGAKVLLVASATDEIQESARLATAGLLFKPLTVETVRLKVDAALGRGPGFNPFRVID